MKATPENFNLYNKHLQRNAYKLRYDMTKAEACLWKFHRFHRINFPIPF